MALAAIAAMCLPAMAQPIGTQSTAQAPATTSNASPTEQPKGKAFTKPSDAAAALYAAAKRDDEPELLVILGPNGKEIVEWSSDPEERREQRANFAEKYEQMHRLVREPDHTVALYVGAENWPVPVPLVEYRGKWYFDADLGRQEIRYRRIGRNEMEALEVCHALVDAEKEYQASAHQYTAKFISTSDKHDGLYWKTSDGSKSPIGPYLAHAGVTGSAAPNLEPYHGYYYRILMGSGDAASFAVLAFPAEYHSSGVMSFLVQPDGKAYERDFADQTASLSKQTIPPQPDNSWKPVD